MAVTNIVASAGDDLYRIAARLYRDASAAILLMRANGLTDPSIDTDIVLVVPSYSSLRTNDGAPPPP